MIDLHVHTNASDGQYSAKEIIDMAIKESIKTIAITDHDSCESVEEAICYGIKKGINVIPGIEITAFDEEEIHILGYNINYKSKEILEYEKYVNRLEEKENDDIFKVLNKQGIQITKKDITQYMKGEKFSTKFVGEWLVDNGYANTRAEAYTKFFVSGDLKNRKSNRMPVEKAIKFINELGGRAVWAHPCRFDTDDKEVINRINKYKSYGLKGIEAIYSMHSDEQIEFLIDYAKQTELIYTFGSDFHGEKVKHNISFGKGKNNNLIKYQKEEIIQEIEKFLV